ncbi:Reverse transcriptase [Phytophthora palmivora]|uniref:Reverse transcriptase n=1 Tax=Phytophthora palmivora TaxID=4796 RepID=A0A2P4WVN7_9STRA|nr:Reverse transcriptase [Phytophthora palmivora]
MPFGLKNALQIYQRLVDNALYGFVEVTQDQDRLDRKDVFESGEPDLERNESVLGRRAYIDDILVTGRSWDSLCKKVVKCTKGGDEILGVIAASITPHKEVDSILVSIAPSKQPRQVISMSPPTVEPDERLLVVSFDGSARVKRSGGAYSGIVWNLPEWTVISAASKYKLDLTVNEAEYHGLLLCLDLLSDMDRGRLIICGDSNLVIRQMKGEIVQDPGIDAATTAGSGTADSLVSAVLQREDGIVITTEEERQDLITVNRLDE